ncbi:2Fe-2S iron-sulfur cluster-binding protein, partial [Terrisporobacter glycolicus]|uniref:2Fe-2S iron-sulfur cluster-binding protein n=1 Tax=Terrisporobacter glycolicus TaxID=36841 RepID=UPI00346492D9
MGEKINLKVLPDNCNIKVEAGNKIIDVLNENNISVESTCAKKGKCGKCKVKV